LDVGEPIPTEPGSLGPFVGVPLPDAWLGFLARDPQAARREFFRAFQLLPLIDELVPALATDGKPLVEDPEQRFTRLLDTRIRAAERRGVARRRSRRNCEAPTGSRYAVIGCGC